MYLQYAATRVGVGFARDAVGTFDLNRGWGLGESKARAATDKIQT